MLIVWILILADLVTGLLFNLEIGFFRIGIIIKSLLTPIIFIIYLRKTKNNSVKSIYAGILILYFIWIIASTLSYLNNPEFDFAYSFVVLNRYSFFLILSLMFLGQNKENYLEINCNSALDTFFIINNSLILVGFLFSINLFSTFDPLGQYPDDHRFGYKGLIYGGNEVAGIYLIGMAHYFRNVFAGNSKYIILLLLTCVAGVLTGTKAILLGIVLFSLYFFIKYKIKTLLLLITPFSILVVSYFYYNWVSIKEKYLTYTVALYEKLDLVSFLTSGRNYYLDKNITYLKSNWSILNFIVGDGYLYNEMDLFDLYFFFGLGSLVYLYLFVKIFFIKDKSKDNIYVFLVLFSASFIAGHIIQSAVVPLFLLLYVFTNRKRNAHLVSS